MRSLIICAAPLAAFVVGCTDAPPSTSPSPARGDVITLVTPATRPTTGSVVTVSAQLVQSIERAALGSFVAAVSYDTLKLRFVAHQALGGSIGAVNADGTGRIVVAGAGARGFADGGLFTLQFQVIDPAGLDGLHLSLRELHGVDLHNRLSRATTRR